jgi:molybdenum cofactor cytidylyltransferase
MPADHPTLDPVVVRTLLEARTTAPHQSVIVPSADGRRGHPVLLSWKLASGVARLPAGAGLNVLVRTKAAETLEVPLPAGAILDDLDTPEDYRRLLERFSSVSFAGPTRKRGDADLC